MSDDEGEEESKEKMDEVSRDQLDKIKARTMYNMVEPLDSGNKKLLFLTNAQALLLASEPQSMEKMLQQLDINEPQLVINLLHSPGFGSWMKAYKGKCLVQLCVFIVVVVCALMWECGELILFCVYCIYICSL